MKKGDKIIILPGAKVILGNKSLHILDREFDGIILTLFLDETPDLIELIGGDGIRVRAGWDWIEGRDFKVVK